MLNKNINKKAAMFGLDARIALAIFGALSVISGASLYSAIQNAKSTALLVEMQEVAKAFEQYYLDTYSYLPLGLNPTCGIPCHFKMEKIITDPTNSYFKGPYLPYTVDAEYTLVSSSDILVSMVQSSTDEEWGLVDNWNSHPCTSGRKCGNWIIMGGFDNENLFKKLDNDIDNGDGASLGSIRWRISSPPWSNHIFYKFMDVKNNN